MSPRVLLLLLFCVFQSATASGGPADDKGRDGPSPAREVGQALTIDDACAADGAGGDEEACSLSARQLRGHKVMAPTESVQVPSWCSNIPAEYQPCAEQCAAGAGASGRPCTPPANASMGSGAGKLGTADPPFWCQYIPGIVVLDGCQSGGGDRGSPSPSPTSRPSPSPSSSPNPSPSSAPGPSSRAGPSAEAACSAHTACASLAGDCCPNSDGNMLSCCEAAATVDETPDSSPDGTPGASSGSGYNQTEAMRFAYLCQAAYCSGGSNAQRDSPPLTQWSCGPSCTNVPGFEDVRVVDNSHYDAHAYVGKLADECYLVFRGTTSFNGWVQDLASLQTTRLDNCQDDNGNQCEVGLGFLENYNSIKQDIRDSLTDIGCVLHTPLAVTGHSLGAAEAVLAIYDLSGLGYNISKSYTFGSPRVGNGAFVNVFNSRFASGFFRVTQRTDPIVYLPPANPFHHVGTEVYYDRSLPHGFRVCDGSGEAPSCLDSTSNDVTTTAQLILNCATPTRCGHYLYLQPELHVILSSCSCNGSCGRSSGSTPSWWPMGKTGAGTGTSTGTGA